MNILSTTKNLFCLLAAVTTISCQKDETKPSIVFEDGSLPSPVFTNAAGSRTIKFSSVLDWTASSSAEWLTLDKPSGSGGEASITLTVTANESYEERTAYVKILSKSSAATIDKTLKVTQDQTDAIITDISSTDIQWEGGDFSIKISSNIEYTVIIDADWVTESTSGTKALAEDTRTFTVSKSWSKDARTATICFKADSSSLATKVLVNQAANPDPGTGEETPFTQNCDAIGAYSGTGGDSPACTVAYSDYQHSFGATSGSRHFRYVDFAKDSLTIMTFQTISLTIGSTYTLVTSCGDNGEMVEKKSEVLTLVSRKYGKIWLEDKTAGTGYIIPTE